MELLIFSINNFTFGISTNFIEGVESISEGNNDITISSNNVIKNGISYFLLNLYQMFFLRERDPDLTKNSILFLKNRICFSVEKFERIKSIETLDFNFSTILPAKYVHLFGGVFISKKRLGIIINGKELESLLNY
ncbi:MAG: hypothetical protein KKH98_04655 [Spirochaetes bacterium]|nr:hypothetical protein [Spirochaetota bacterium]